MEAVEHTMSRIAPSRLRRTLTVLSSDNKAQNEREFKRWASVELETYFSTLVFTAAIPCPFIVRISSPGSKPELPSDAYLSDDVTINLSSIIWVSTGMEREPKIKPLSENACESQVSVKSSFTAY